MYISVRICKFKIFKQKSHFKKNVIAIAIAQNVPLYGQTLFNGQSHTQPNPGVQY